LVLDVFEIGWDFEHALRVQNVGSDGCVLRERGSFTSDFSSRRLGTV
jgi:hypothetical protein